MNREPKRRCSKPRPPRRVRIDALDLLTAALILQAATVVALLVSVVMGR